jgi:crotonobetainyl-CoA:carnitine CoA-transferase CaiB-like acyl-CoA transferase
LTELDGVDDGGTGPEGSSLDSTGSSSYRAASGHMALTASVLAALDHRDRTGEGPYLDFSQAEASLHLLAPALLDYHVNGRISERMGNDDLQVAPHGVYRCSGHDQWVAIACETDKQWQALCGHLELHGMARDSELAGAFGRLSRRREIDEAITAWTTDRTAQQAQDHLQAQGIPAHQVQNSPECHADPQLEHLGHFCPVDHPVQGTTWVEGSRFRLSRTPGEVTRAAPMIGEHSFEILSEILGYDADHIAELAAAQLLG